MIIATPNSRPIPSSRYSWSSFALENIKFSKLKTNKDPDEEFDSVRNKPQGNNAHKFSSRQMSYEQEILNAFTMIPSPLYCIHKVFSGGWISKQARTYAESECGNTINHSENYNVSMISLLPPPMLAILIAVLVHFPFSFYYHWLCATHIPKGHERITHITRRLDHAFIHISLALCSYAASGNVQYFLLSALFNVDCVCRHFEEEVSIQLFKLVSFHFCEVLPQVFRSYRNTFLHCRYNLDGIKYVLHSHFFF